MTAAQASDVAILTTSVTSSVAAEILGVGVVQFGVLVRDGWITQQPDGRYRVVDVTRGYLRSRLDAGQAERRERDNQLAAIKLAERNLALAERRAALMNLLGAMQYCGELLRPLFKKLIGEVPRRAYPRDHQRQQQLMKLFEEIRDEFEAEQERESTRIKATAGMH
jgi:hypothetical protein